SPPIVIVPAAPAAVVCMSATYPSRAGRTLRPKARDSMAEKNSAGLPELRHTAAHVLAYAVQDLFPDAKPTIGPAIENGFYYDFDRAEPFTPEDLERLEARMREIVKANYEMTGHEVQRDEAL